jgi:hypothetical protein
MSLHAMPGTRRVQPTFGGVAVNEARGRSVRAGGRAFTNLTPGARQVPGTGRASPHVVIRSPTISVPPPVIPVITPGRSSPRFFFSPPRVKLHAPSDLVITPRRENWFTRLLKWLFCISLGNLVVRSLQR